MYGTYHNGESLESRSKQKRHPNEGKSQESLIEKCRNETVINGVCPYGQQCQVNCPHSSSYKEPEKKKLDKKAVFRIANKIARSVSRKDAFALAWKIVKNGGYEIKVAGVSFENRQEALRRLTQYDPKNIRAFLAPEFDNQYDANAISVQVMVDGGKNVYRLGYVPKTETAVIKAFLGTVPELAVIDGDIRGARLRLAA